MKAKQIVKALEKYTEALHQKEIEEGIVSYALFDTVKRAFINFSSIGHVMYTGDVKEAYITDNKGEACNTVITMLDGYFEVKIVPLISNDLFGLSPAPGSLDNDYDEFD
jgi:hypothetical protein